MSRRPPGRNGRALLIRELRQRAHSCSGSIGPWTSSTCRRTSRGSCAPGDTNRLSMFTTPPTTTTLCAPAGRSGIQRGGLSSFEQSSTAARCAASRGSSLDGADSSSVWEWRRRGPGGVQVPSSWRSSCRMRLLGTPVSGWRRRFGPSTFELCAAIELRASAMLARERSVHSVKTSTYL